MGCQPHGPRILALSPGSFAPESGNWASPDGRSNRDGSRNLKRGELVRLCPTSSSVLTREIEDRPRPAKRETIIWIFTQSGFVSVVRHCDHRNLLLVRSRDRDSLAALCRRVGLADSEISELENADYRYRLVCSDAVLLRFLRGSVEELDYPNFKSRVLKVRGSAWHDALTKIWSVMRSLQPGSSGKLTD
jgi:hypothetical protein